jgi:phage tail sheath gpL-like
MSSLVLTIKTARADVADFAVDSSCDIEGLQGLRNLLEAAESSHEPLECDLQYSTVDPVAASGTFTLVSAIATDAVTIGTITLTATSTPTTDLHWEIDGASDTLDAASLAAAINANPTLSKVVAATSATNVVTITALQKGLVGNQIPISSADATITASDAFLTGGTGGAASAAKTYSSL